MTQAIGIFGGAFSPFHNGHLRLAIEARDRLELGAVHLVPTAYPPHRPDSRISPHKRFEWVRLAARREPGLVADDCEIRREGPSYTVDTLRGMRERYMATPLVLLMGADAFGHLHSWSRWREILTLAHIAVVTRPGASVEASHEAAAELAGRRIEDFRVLHEEPAGRWLTIDPPVLDISSTRIRCLLREGRSVRGLVPDAILNSMSASDRAALAQDEDATTH
ncbi:MAG TPA: nicotinate-nucleotide adenylyltransferase [Nevskiaceae bacterium]|nr:nicotinate-nucleotide adenylyltransferase [Nevskiaceae bacterium]